MFNSELLKYYPVEHLIQLPKGNPTRREIEKMAQLEPRLVVADRVETIVPAERSKEAPEPNLDVEWGRQADIRVARGFHVAAGFPDTNEGRQAFLNSLPRFEPQPKGYEGRLDAPRLVIGEIIPWEVQAELAGISISDYLRERIAKTVPVNERSRAPKGSYTGWFNRWGLRFENKIAPDDARKKLQKDEVGGNPFEAIADYLADPALNASGRFWDVIGYSVESGGVPYLYRWDDGPRFGAGLGDDADDDFRPLVRGSKIVTR